MFLRLESLNNLVFKTGQVFSMNLAIKIIELTQAMWLLIRLLIFGSKNYIRYCFSISVYVPVALIKKRLKIDASLYNILQVLSRSLFEKYH